MQSSQTDAHERTRRPPRWAVVAVVVLLTAVGGAAAYVASARLADAACSADPPGITMPVHQSRSLKPGVDGWDCTLRDYVEAESTTVHLGWWPTNPAALWEQVERPTD